MDIFLGFLGFLLYFLYDINSVTKKNRVLQKGFLLGTCLVAAATTWFFIKNRAEFYQLSPKNLIFAAAAVLFFLLLIYTLFFAIPFKKTYVEACEKRRAYTGGVYGLCRHPGVLWFSGFYICLAAIAGNAGCWRFCLWVTALNVIYIVFQDLWTFPRTFSNYDEYKKMTPFLFPSRKSIRVCLDTIRIH